MPSVESRRSPISLNALLTRETAFMALFGRRCLPHRSSLSRFLAAVDGPCLEAFRTLFQQRSFIDGWRSETIGGVWDRQGRRSIVFDVDATEPGRHGNEHSPVILSYPRQNADSKRSVRPATQGASEVRWSAHGPLLCKCILVNGSLPTQARAMGTIVASLPRRGIPSRPT